LSQARYQEIVSRKKERRPPFWLIQEIWHVRDNRRLGTVAGDAIKPFGTVRQENRITSSEVPFRLEISFPAGSSVKCLVNGKQPQTCHARVSIHDSHAGKKEKSYKVIEIMRISLHNARS